MFYIQTTVGFRLVFRVRPLALAPGAKETVYMRLSYLGTGQTVCKKTLGTPVNYKAWDLTGLEYDY